MSMSTQVEVTALSHTQQPGSELRSGRAAQLGSGVAAARVHIAGVPQLALPRALPCPVPAHALVPFCVTHIHEYPRA